MRLRANILSELGLRETALRILEDALGQMPNAPGASRRAAEAAEGAEHADRAVELHRQVLLGRYDDLESRQRLIADAIARGEEDVVLAHLDAPKAVFPDRVRTLLYMAEVHEALGHTDEALATVQKARDLSLENPDVFALYGKILLRLDRNDAA